MTDTVRHEPKAAVILGATQPARVATAADWTYCATKRTLDVLVSAAALVLLAPLTAVIALLVKLDSRGPVMFRHRRIGRRAPGGAGRPFTLYKFRTMVADARDRFPELYAYDHSAEDLEKLPIKLLVGGKRWPSARQLEGKVWLERSDDPRLTRVGRWLRRTSLDELPNFLNVLKGDMSLVGPRPDIADNIRYYREEHLRKLDVRPGITGLAQIRGRGNLTFHEINEYDVEYVNRRSFALDVEILLATIGVAMRRDGAL